MPEDSATPDTLDGGTYEIIRQRLSSHGEDLRTRLTKLNAERQEVFGAVEPELVATERVTTPNNCIPRDMVAIGGGRFLFGFNVHIGLKSTTAPADVFATYQYDAESHRFSALPVEEILRDDNFLYDFGHLYKYYKQTVFAKFLLIGPHLYMAFRTGRDVTDIKTFKWLLHGNGQLEYLGNRFDHEYQFPEQQEFEWTRAHRDMQRSGDHPHVSIEDRLFVETVGGDLTIKIEDNTESGEGIYAEPVEEVDQTLDDAEIFYALIGNLILVKIRPYQEDAFRYFIYNEKLQSVTRVDSIEDSCVLLPDDHGVIFSNGFHLQSGETKLFESGLSKMLFERRIAAPNGEDYFYIFYNRASGDYILMSYNVIGRQVDTPISCHGYSVFPNGELVYFRTEDQPQKHHVLQVWQTPYHDPDIQLATAKSDHYLYKLGNAEIVRCMAECHEVLNLLHKDDTYADLYVDLAKRTADIANSYFWIDHAEAHRLKEPLTALQTAAQSAIDEFDKVLRLRQTAASESEDVTTRARRLMSQAEHSAPDDIMGFVHHLSELRTVRGETISIRDLRYADTKAVDALEAEIQEVTERLSQRCVAFLLKPEALDPYSQAIEEQKAAVAKVAKVAEGKEVGEQLNEAGHELELLIEIVGNLKIEDATQTTQIIESISDLYSILNQVKVELKNRVLQLGKAEGSAQFHAEIKLLNQAVVNYLDLCDEPAKCEESLTKVMVQLEELESKYAEFDDFVSELSDKRTEVYDAFESRKVSLVESRNKRANNLQKSAERILQGVQKRLAGFEEISEINAYLASDLMIEKVRDIVVQLQELDDPVKADGIQTQLKTLREEAVRQLKDRRELYVDGQNIIQFGNHRFSVNQQDLELTIVPHEDTMCYHLTGTRYFEAISDPDFLETESVWEQELISENSDIYRSEYLAYRFFLTNESRSENEDDLRQFMAPRYAEGYTKGVHDHDALLLLKELYRIRESIGLLRYDADARAKGLLLWESWVEDDDKKVLEHQLLSFGAVQELFPDRDEQKHYIEVLHQRLAEMPPVIENGANLQAAEYLLYELANAKHVTASPEAAQLIKEFQTHLTGKRQQARFQEIIKKLEKHPLDRFEVIRDWLSGFSSGHPYLNEASVHLLRGSDVSATGKVAISCDIKGMLGSHSVVDEGLYSLHYNRFMNRLQAFCQNVVPVYERYTHGKAALAKNQREKMRLDEFKPRVMSSFVRNRLLDRVYLPLIGDNLAKQIGVAGEETRADRMGLLLLISPPGYGKTTLMEYVADRLGLTFMKINGPAIGHTVTSLDPNEAPNASAREEVNKLNLALEMGDNVMIYLDDIQHCHPEFLQKFISLCDGQRRMEGVFNGKARTYDLRGRKVAVVMAGNPYTEQGGKFQIPDMLANRADTYNLGDIIGGHADAFKDSYIENCLTSNAVLNTLAAKSQKDVYAIMQIATTGGRDGAEFEGNYSAEEVTELVAVMKKLFRVRDTILRVNLEYIRSAAQADEYRTEPPFKLQGSYRNMNRIAEKILPIMTDEEVIGVIHDHYENEAQTLTTGAEANLLKFKEMEEALTEEETARWADIKETFQRNLLVGGAGDNDPVSRIVGQLSAFTTGINQIEKTIAEAAKDRSQPATLADDTVSQLEKIIAGLRSVPVDVEIKVVPVHAGKDAPEPTQELPVAVDSKVKQKTDDSA